jgi:antitoxin component YwqK of YwqJK toxin-antitoxin module
MTRDQHLEFCSRCTNRKFDSEKGIICQITNDIAAFENTCAEFTADATVKTPSAPAAESIADHQLVAELPEKVKTLLRKQQDPVLAVVGGLSAAILGGLIWAAITVATNYQIGYMAIGVGLLVGFSVRYFGAGVDQYFGLIGAALALAGCAIGNLLAQVGFAANEGAGSYIDILSVLNIELIISIFKESFSPMDVLFYGIAAYEGYKFAFRKVTGEVYDSAAKGQLTPLPFGQFRIPVAIVLYILFAVVGFTVRSAANAEKIVYYPTGEKQATGFYADGKESGQWQFWWQNGNLMSKGIFLNGKQDSVWETYSEEGKLFRRVTYKSGFENGAWTELYEDGKISSTGKFVNGRKEGEWNYYYTDGVLSQRVHYKLDNLDGPVEYFFASGKPSATENYKNGEPRGLWVSWYESGNKMAELDYGAEGNLTIVNSWSDTGKPEVINGNGTYDTHYPNGQVDQTGLVKDRKRVGIWKSFYQDGSKKEVGHYAGDVYLFDSVWSPDGKILVQDGEGTYVNYTPDNNIIETGKISHGLREGKWTVHYPESESIMSTTQFTNGEQDGLYQAFFEDGTVQIEGQIKMGKRDGTWKWFFQNGTLETSVDFRVGKKEGPQPFYLDDGTLTKTEVYKNNELVESTIEL